MSSTTKLSKEQLSAIAKVLKQKLIDPNGEHMNQEKKVQKKSKEPKMVEKGTCQINSDSEMEAIELFEEMKVKKGGVV